MASGLWTDSGNYASSFNGGSGTSSSPYLIATAAQLARMAYLINSSSYSSYRASYYKLTANISLSAHYWVPIGSYTNSNYYFSGNFNGNGYNISGLTTVTTSGYSRVGLFGYVNSGSIYGVNLLSPTCVNTNASYVGALLGESPSAYLSNIYVNNATVTSKSYAGSVCGAGAYSMTNIYVYSCTVNGVYAGGVCGQFVGGAIIDGCNVRQTVLNGTTANGGISGWHNVSSGVNVECCTIDIISASSSTYGGGIVGHIQYSYEELTVTKCVINRWAGTSSDYIITGSGGTVTASGCVYDSSGRVSTTNTGVSDGCTAWNFSSTYSTSSHALNNFGTACKRIYYATNSLGDDFGTNGTNIYYRSDILDKYESGIKPVYLAIFTDTKRLLGGNSFVYFVITDTDFTVPSASSGYRGLTFTARKATETGGTDIDNSTTYSFKSGDVIYGYDREWRFTVDGYDTTKGIQYQKDSSTVVTVDEIYYSQPTSGTVVAVSDYKYMKNGGTLV